MKEEDNLDYLLKFFVKGSFILFIGVIISKIATYGYKLVIARTFGQEVYGLFSLAVMIFTLFDSFFSLGLQSGILRNISLFRGKNEFNKIQVTMRFSIFITLLTSLIAGVLLFFLSKFIAVGIFHNSELTIFLQSFSIFLPVFLFCGLFHVITIAYEKVGWYSFIGNILSPITQLISLIIFIFIGIKTNSIIFSYNLGLVAILLSSFLVCKFGIKRIFNKSDLEKKERYQLYKDLFSYSWPIMFFGLVVSIFSWIDSFTIGYFKTVADVGIYNAAVPLAVLLQVIPSLFLQLFLPVIIKEYSRKNFDLIKKLTKQIGKWIFLLNIPILIIMILFPGAVINIFFGSGYIQAENSLRFLAIGLFFYSIFNISENLLSMIGKSKIVLLNLIISSILNISLNILLIPKYGISGAAFSTMLSYILWGFLSFFIAKHHTAVNPLRWDMLKIFLIAIPPAVLLFYARSIFPLTIINMILMGLAFIFLYISLILLTHMLDNKDLMILRSIKDKIFHRFL